MTFATCLLWSFGQTPSNIQMSFCIKQESRKAIPSMEDACGNESKSPSMVQGMLTFPPGHSPASVTAKIQSLNHNSSGSGTGHLWHWVGAPCTQMDWLSTKLTLNQPNSYDEGWLLTLNHHMAAVWLTMDLKDWPHFGPCSLGWLCIPAHRLCLPTKIPLLTLKQMLIERG